MRRARRALTGAGVGFFGLMAVWHFIDLLTAIRFGPWTTMLWHELAYAWNVATVYYIMKVVRP